jgi:hypothetical protein
MMAGVNDIQTKLHGNGIVEIIDGATILKDSDDFFGILFINNCSTVLIKKENIPSDFFDLSTGIAGEILQKFSTYGKRMAILGDFENIKSRALKDFIYESNKTKQILFVNTVEKALEIFNE